MLRQGLFILLLTPFFLAACSDDGATSAPSVPTQAPVIEAFSAQPTTVDQGGSTELRWRVTGEPPPQLTLTPGPQSDVTGRNSLRVTPSAATTYTLSAANSAGSAQKTLEIGVSAPIVLPPTEIAVTLNPGLVDLAPGQRQDFAASVIGADDPRVTWQVSESGGTLEVDGAQATYTAPTVPGSYTLTATSVADPSKSATATVRVSEVGVSITPASETLAPGRSRTFNAEVVGANDTEVTWQASSGAASLSVNGAAATYTAPEQTGSYTLTATSVADPSKSATATITVSTEPDTTPEPNSAPSANFSFEAEGLSVRFDAATSSDSDGSITSYAWDFGDGEAGEGVQPEHSYAEAGTYMVTLTVTDNEGQSAQVETSLEVFTTPAETPERAPSVLFELAPQAGASPLTVNFDASASQDPDGSIVLYEWDFGDDETGEGVQTEHTYEEADTYTVTLTLEDDDGNSASASKTLTVAPAEAPSASASLRLSEVSRSFAGNAHWIEVYNASDKTLNLEDFELRSSSSRGDTTFSLPPLNLNAGGYALIIAEVDEAMFDGPRHVHIRDGNAVPAWDESGFVELVGDGATLDFVRFGNSDETPETGAAWQGGAAPALGNGASLARDSANTDTDAASDWTLQTFATAGGPNDVPNNARDNDDDGIPDSAEVAGGTFAGLDLFAMGARTSQPDIFVEVDYMNTTDMGVMPQRGALDKVVAAFDKQGIRLHFDVGTRFSNTFSPNTYNLGGGEPVVPFSQGIAFSSTDDGHANFYEIKAQKMDITRRQLFHYAVFAYSQQMDGEASSVGEAEVGGNDLYVTLGGLGYSAAVSANFQAGALMHELGHNLGLRHGGENEVNDKPNYLSVMNYLYTLTGIGPTTGQGAGDRYGLSRHSVGTYGDLVDSPTNNPGSFVIDYSDGSSASLNERNLDENNGLGRGATWVDFNDDGTRQNSLEFDLNDDGEFDVLEDHDDWGSLTLPFSPQRKQWRQYLNDVG